MQHLPYNHDESPVVFNAQILPADSHLPRLPMQRSRKQAPVEGNAEHHRDFGYSLYFVFSWCGCEASSGPSPSNVAVPHPPAQPLAPCRPSSPVSVNIPAVSPMPFQQAFRDSNSYAELAVHRQDRGSGIWPITPWSRRSGQSSGEKLAAHGSQVRG